MSTTTTAAVAGVAIVLAGWCARHALRIGTDSVAVAYRRLYAPRPRPIAPVASMAGMWDRLFSGFGDRIARSAAGERFEARRRYSLRAANIGVAMIVARVLTAAVVGFVLTAVAVAVTLPLGGGVPPALALATPFVIALLLGWYQLQSILAAAAQRYREFRSGVATYIALVSVCMTTPRSMNEAITYSADVGTGPAFTTISNAVHAAPQMGIRVWEALDAVGAEYDCRELQDLASSVGHVARIGVGVESTVTAVATRMRQVALDEMQRTADRQTATMFGPTMLFVLGTVAFLGYPLVVRLLDAFANPI